ncbi:hypothetical protein, partial [Shewanella baltica]|uniref:hypothetical protein n=1 Tax=Shewanella baltica TaxID=62322 RepID=UPI003D799CC6
GCIASSWLFYSEVLTRLMGKLIGDADQICGYGFSSTYLGNKAADWSLLPFKKNWKQYRLNN